MLGALTESDRRPVLVRIPLPGDVPSEDSRVVGCRRESWRFTSQAPELTSSRAPHLVLDESTNWFPSASLKIAAVPQCSVFGGIGNSTPFADSSS